MLVQKLGRRRGTMAHAIVCTGRACRHLWHFQMIYIFNRIFNRNYSTFVLLGMRCVATRVERDVIPWVKLQIKVLIMKQYVYTIELYTCIVMSCDTSCLFILGQNSFFCTFRWKKIRLMVLQWANIFFCNIFIFFKYCQYLFKSIYQLRCYYIVIEGNLGSTFILAIKFLYTFVRY